MKQIKKIKKIRKVKIENYIAIVDPVNLYQRKIEDNYFVGYGLNFINEKLLKKIFLKTKVENNIFVGSKLTIFLVSFEKIVVIGSESIIPKTVNEAGHMSEIQKN